MCGFSEHLAKRPYRFILDGARKLRKAYGGVIQDDEAVLPSMLTIWLDPFRTVPSVLAGARSPEVKKKEDSSSVKAMGRKVATRSLTYRVFR